MQSIADKISARLTQEAYASEEVRRHLEKFARLLTREHDPNVQLIKHRTAQTRNTNDGLAIDITNQKIDQPVTNIQEDAWQLLAREALLIHEIGHVLYTDFDAHQEVMEDVPMHEKNQFHKIYNATEDAVVDQQLRWKFNCSEELDTHLANLFSEGKRNAEHLDLLGAVHVSILEKGVYPVGILEEHQKGERQLVKPEFESEFQEALQMIDDLLSDAMSEPTAKARYERMYEFWEDLKDLLPDVRKQDGGDGDMSDMIPDDTSGMTPGDDADELEDIDPEDIQEMVSEIGAPPAGEQDEDGEEGEGEAGDDDLDLGDLFGGGGEDDEEADEDGDDEAGGQGGEEADEDSDGQEGEQDGEADSEPGEEPGDGDAGGDGKPDDEAEQDADSGGSDTGKPGDGDSDELEIEGHEGHSLAIVE